MIKKITLLILLCVIFLSFLSEKALALSTKPKGPKKYIRVAIIKDKKELTLRLKGGYQILTIHTNELIKEGSRLKAIVKPTYSGLKLNNEDIKIFGIRVQSRNNASIWINSRRFRGIVDIIRQPNLTLLVVNHVDIEEYLCGVLYQEISHLWPFETLKAQAIAARTFALYEHKVNKNKDYDLTNTSFSQVYGGATSEKYRTTRAVIKTYGEILTYKGKIFPAYYHATCGGHTEDASRIWGINLAPLKGVKCDFCKHSPYYKWTRKISLKFIQKKLNENNLNIGTIYSIIPLSYDNSGRVINLKIKHSKGETTIPAYKFRLMIGTTTIASTKFKVNINSGYAKFQGNGWGHGVGMCQWGALFMALKGYKAQEILKFYYPGSEIENIWPEDVRPK